MRQHLQRLVGPVLSVVLFAAAVWVLHRELRSYHLKDVLHALDAIPAGRLWAAAALTGLSYVLMTGYDALAMRYIRHPLAYTKIGLASFIGYAFSNNIGLSMIAGASVRYRLYSVWGLSTVQITQVVAFCTLTLWLGFFCLGGGVFVVDPLTIPAALRVPLGSVRLAGAVMLVIVLVYVFVTLLKKTPLTIREWEIDLPPIHTVLLQLVLGALDWALAGAVLYVLIAPVVGMSYPGFLSVYLLAQMMGLVSQVPGGLGVFETSVVLLLSPGMASSQILGALLAYRAMYYWMPLGVAALLLGLQEVLRRGTLIPRVAAVFEHWVSPLLPQVMAFAAFVGGAILLFSGATPVIDHRLAGLRMIIPLALLELSHFAGSMAGMGLLLLARGLQRRLDAAYHITLVLLAVGIASSLIKGFDYEEAWALALIMAALLPARRHFHRKASLISERFNAGWIAAVLIVLGCSIWLGFYAYRHVEYTDRLWWQFAFSNNASRFLRATMGAVILGLFFAAARLLRPAPPPPKTPGPEELGKIWPIVQQSPNTAANLALLGDKFFLFSAEGDAFIMYGIEGRSWIAMGDPVGSVQRWPDLIWRFRELSDRYGGRTVFYEVGHEHLHLYLDLGLSMLKLGEEARVPLQVFSLEGGSRKGLRQSRHKLEKEGWRFEVLAPATVSLRLPELKEISDAWLSEKNTREKGFSLGFFHSDYLRRCPVAVVVKNDRLAAFANLWRGGAQEELSVDLMRYGPDAPDGVMDYLFVCIMLWGKAQGYRWFNLGMAPLSGLENRALAPLWNRLGAFVFRHGEHFYNFQGLRQYKAKFDPQWRPKYLASPGGLAFPQIFANIAALISGGMKGVVAK
jgi:phosphatidylglycerol lysyltransferase